MLYVGGVYVGVRCGVLVLTVGTMSVLVSTASWGGMGATTGAEGAEVGTWVVVPVALALIKVEA